MKTSYSQILSLYFRNTSFLLLFGVFLCTALFSKIFYHLGYGYDAEEMFTVLFVVSLWLAFHLGILIKRQFSTYRAHLLPNYGRPHLFCILAVYVVFLLVAYWWEFGIAPVIEMSSSGLWGVYLTCLFMAILITYLGYLSIGRVLIYAYVFLLLFSHQAFNVILILDQHGVLVTVIGAACIVFAVIFGRRLLQLREDHFEFGHLFAWPPRHFIIGQLRANDRMTENLSPLTKFLPVPKNIIEVPKYPRGGNLFSRAYHWDYTEHTDLKVIWVMLLLVAPLFLLFLSQRPAWIRFNEDVYANFLLLSMTPVLIAIGANYKRLGYWGYDLLKPVNKQEYLKEQAVIVLANLFLYWLLFGVCFAILPNIIFHPELFVSKKFWGYIALTGTVSFLTLSWLGLLSCFADSLRVITHGIVLSLIILFFFYCVPRLTFEAILYSNVLCLMGGMVMLCHAYQSWGEKEFHE